MGSWRHTALSHVMRELNPINEVPILNERYCTMFFMYYSRSCLLLFLHFLWERKNAYCKLSIYKRNIIYCEFSQTMIIHNSSDSLHVFLPSAWETLKWHVCLGENVHVNCPPPQHHSFMLPLRSRLLLEMHSPDRNKSVDISIRKAQL